MKIKTLSKRTTLSHINTNTIQTLSSSKTVVPFTTCCLFVCNMIQEWWDSLFKPSVSSEGSKRLSHGVDLGASDEMRDAAESVKSTAAALRLSDALQHAPRSYTGAVDSTQSSSVAGHSGFSRMFSLIARFTVSPP